MARRPHVERHFTGSATLQDVVIGMSDGLTVPFALAAGLSSAAVGGGVIVTAGVAEIAAGAIAMGLGGYLAARTAVDHYRREYARELRETHELPVEERREVASILAGHGLAEPALGQVVQAISSDRARWVDFMMRFELGLEAPDERRAPISAATIAGSYIVGGLIPLAPYMAIAASGSALRASVAVTLVALFVFGVVRGRLAGLRPLRSGVETAAIGAAAAGCAYALAALIA